jgi:hypothetical protein
MEGDLLAGVFVACHYGVTLHRHGEDKSLIVVGMLSDQIHSSRGCYNATGGTAKTLGEQLSSPFSHDLEAHTSSLNDRDKPRERPQRIRWQTSKVILRIAPALSSV